MGGIHNKLRALGPTIPLAGLRTEQAIVQVGDKLLAGLDPSTRRWAEQQASMLSKKLRFGASEQSQLAASVTMSYPKLDPVAKEKLQLTVVYLALRASAPRGLNSVTMQPASRTLFQSDILAG